MNNPSQKKEQKTKKYEIRDRFFTITSPIVSEPSLIEIPENEVIIGITHIPGTTNRFCIYTAEEVPF